MILEQNTCVYKLLRLEGKENKKQTMIWQGSQSGYSSTEIWIDLQFGNVGFLG